MGKITIWRVRTEDAEHTVTYTLHRITGRMTVTLDGEPFELSAAPLSLRAARREPFRIVSPDGEAEMAILAVDGGGKASLLFRGEEIPSEVRSVGVVVERNVKGKGQNVK